MLQIGSGVTIGGGISMTDVPIVTTGLVLYLDAGTTLSYPGSGTTWTDLSGNGYNATLTGPTYSNGNNGYFSFNGSGNYASFSGSNLPGGTNACTMTAWVYPTQVTQNRIIMWYGTAAVGQARGFEILASGEFRFFGYGSDIGSGLSFTLNQWAYCTVTYDGTTQKTYLNAVAGNTATLSWNTTLAATAYIGADIAFGGGRWWQGRVATASIYNRALSAAEITQNYNAFKGRYGL